MENENRMLSLAAIEAALPEADAEVQQVLDDWAKDFAKDAHSAFDWAKRAMEAAANQKVSKRLHWAATYMAKERGDGLVDLVALKEKAAEEERSAISNITSDGSSLPSNAMKRFELKAWADAAAVNGVGGYYIPFLRAVGTVQYAMERDKRRAIDEASLWVLTNRSGKLWRNHHGMWVRDKAKAARYGYADRENVKLEDGQRWERLDAVPAEMIA